MLNEQREQQVIELCQELIQEKSYSGEEQGLVDNLKEAFSWLGFDASHVDKYGNIIGEIRGKRPGRKVLLDGHIDTVPVPDPAAWQHDPFGGELADGKIYGRGASDMKGAVAAMACAAGYFAHDCNKDFAGSIYVAGVVHEECFEGVAAREISRRLQPDYVIIGEASELNMKIGQRGRAEIVTETFGKPAHSANPHKGVNAVYQMARLIESIRALPANQGHADQYEAGNSIGERGRQSHRDPATERMSDNDRRRVELTEHVLDQPCISGSSDRMLGSR